MDIFMFFMCITKVISPSSPQKILLNTPFNHLNVGIPLW